jgi:WD repeat-containing protein 48
MCMRCFENAGADAQAAWRPQGFVASAGLDKDVYIWDIEGSSNPVSRSPGGAGSGGGRAPVKCQGHNDSIYSVATNSAGSLVVSGSIESTSSSMGLIRLWDPRTGERAGRLKGHTDNIRALLLSQDGAMCISSGSDATIRVWDIGQQRCLQVTLPYCRSGWSSHHAPQSCT